MFVAMLGIVFLFTAVEGVVIRLVCKWGVKMKK